jgi:hypothetical protein
LWPINTMRHEAELSIWALPRGGAVRLEPSRYLAPNATAE